MDASNQRLHLAGWECAGDGVIPSMVAREAELALCLGMPHKLGCVLCSNA